MDQNKHEKFKNSFRKDQWEELIKHDDFNLAFNTGDFSTAGEIASRILYGEARNAKERKELKYRKRILDEFN